MKLFALVLVASAGLASSASAQSLVPLSTFGVNGWRAPGAVQAGDAAGTAPNGVYLGLNGAGSNTERGLAYNRATGNLILVTRNGDITAGATQIRVLDSTTGQDLRGLQQPAALITGGDFAVNQVGISDSGQVFVTNMSSNIRTGPGFRVYTWGNDNGATVPTLHYASSSLGSFGAGGTNPRLGDSFDVIGSGANTRLVAGFSGIQGYVTITGDTSPTGRVYTGTATPTPPAGSGTLTGTNAASRFAAGITFAGNGDTIWGKITGATASVAHLVRNQITGGTANTIQQAGLASAGESRMDFATIDGQNFLATLDANNGRVYIYNVNNPAAPQSVFTFAGSPTGFSAIPGTATYNSNGNATGSVQWGAINNSLAQATLYVLSSNNGIQAFTFTVPTPGAMALLGLGGLVAGRRRR
ncbi:MAG: hypothetical protein K2X32_12135 [Phycisphaerales bacterium]|nr:hypothetical protein [Phycisphaerales bacterium]